jgi:membrane associated rhomboid family serine protease
MFPIGDDNRGARGLAIITVVLVILNVLIFLYEATLNEQQLQDFVVTYGVVPREIQNGQDLFTLITSMFVHGGWAHVGGNMLFLWIFGDNLERRFGSLKYLLFYFACGIAAGLMHVITNSGSEIPSVGASGAISGIMGGYIVLYPQNRVKVLVGYGGLAMIPAFIFLGIWFVTQLVNGVAALNVDTAQTSGVAFWAHIGGFVAGVVGAFLLRGVTRDPAVAPENPPRRGMFG